MPHLRLYSCGINNGNSVAIDQQRTYNRKSYYKIIKLIKEANERGENIVHSQIYLMLSQLGVNFGGTTTLNKFIREAESWGY